MEHGTRSHAARRVERRMALRESLALPHPDSIQWADEGLADWLDACPINEKGLVDEAAGRAIRWEPGVGWVVGDR